MLSLSLTTSLLGNELRLLDQTPAYNATSAPGGYGGPNKAQAEVLLIGVVGRQKAGGYRFTETVYADAGEQLRFALPGAGVYVALVLAVSRVLPLADAPAGTLWLSLDGRLMRKLQADSMLGAEELVLSHYTLDELRDLQPALQVEADESVPVLYLGLIRRQLDELLLGFVRSASGSYPRGTETLAGPWLQAAATLESVELLVSRNRFSEAAQHLAGLQQLVGFDALATAPLAEPAQTDWLSTQLR